LTGSARAAEFRATAALQTFYTSNVFLDRSEEWDVAVQPSLGLGVDFSEYWSARYNGTLDVYAIHGDLLAGWNRLALIANPAWGKEDQNEFYAQLSIEALNNTSTYNSLDYLSPALTFGIVLEPTIWFRWKLSNQELFRLFYHDRPADGIDSRTGTEFTFTLPSRTTISPRLDYSCRFYTEPDRSMKNDRFDQQVEPGIHASQGLWETGGLQADYSYRQVIGSNALFDRQMSQTQFSYLGEDFLFSGHRASIKLTQIIPGGWKLAAGVEYQTRAYGDWPAVDSEGRDIGVNRDDQRLTPGVDVEYKWSPPEKKTNSTVPAVRLSARYSFTKEWSNSYMYDTNWHFAAIDLALSW
jgi:hypothetical protein